MPARVASILSTLLFIATCFTASITFNTNQLHAAEYSLAIQPILPDEELKRIYQPLADYLSQESGHTIKIATYRSFTYYWHKMRKRKRGFDLVLDAAHFTDYRIQKFGYTVLAKMPDTVSFSIVTREDNFVLDVEELISARIATLPTPSLGAVRLEQYFNNPMRIPNYVYELNSNIAVESVISGKVDAAIIPTRLASTYTGLNTVDTTDPVPHMAISSSADTPEDVVNLIRQALLDADKTEQGKKMLTELKVSYFEATDNSTYEGYAELLKGTFGY